MHVPSDIAYCRLTYDADRAPAWKKMLSAEERARLDAFPRAERRRAFLLGRAAARTLLAEQLGTCPADVPLHVAPGGCVEVGGADRLLSIPHSGPRAVAATARRRVGVDLERIRPRRAGIERFLLHPDEPDLLDRLPLGRARALILCWTLKEAALKAARTGLRRFPTRLRLHVDLPAQAAHVRDEIEAWHVRFEEWDGCYLAVAFEP